LLEVKPLELSNGFLFRVGLQLIEVLDVQPSVLKVLCLIDPLPLLVIKDVSGKGTILFDEAVG
jgi:hypothetical protein